MKQSARLFSTLASMTLAACTSGPDYAGPAGAGAVAPPAMFTRAGTALPTQPMLAAWWRVLGDPVLDALQARALADSPTVAIARARLAQARASARLERANALPSSNATALYLRGDLPPTNLGIGTGDGEDSAVTRSTIDLYNVGFDASWEADLSGGQRRRTEAARASAEVAAANLADAQVSLTADVAQAYVQLRDRQARIAIVRRSSALQRETVTLVRQRVGAGTATRSELEQAVQQQTATDARLTPLEVERDTVLNALSVLVGIAPGGLDTMLKAAAPVPRVPAIVAVGDPAGMLQRRPDVRAAERELANKTASIGVAQAARFPRISFMGLLGLGGSNAGDVFDPGNLSLLALPRIQWSFLDFGRNRARIRGAEAARDEAEARYDNAVLVALRDAEDSLAQFGGRRAALANAIDTERSAQRAAALAQRRFAAGTRRRTDALDAERQKLDAEGAVVQAMADVTIAYVAVQKALGLGWSAESRSIDAVQGGIDTGAARPGVRAP